MPRGIRDNHHFLEGHVHERRFAHIQTQNAFVQYTSTNTQMYSYSVSRPLLYAKAPCCINTFVRLNKGQDYSDSTFSFKHSYFSMREMIPQPFSITTCQTSLQRSFTHKYMSKETINLMHKISKEILLVSRTFTIESNKHVLHLQLQTLQQ